MAEITFNIEKKPIINTPKVDPYNLKEYNLAFTVNATPGQTVTIRQGDIQIDEISWGDNTLIDRNPNISPTLSNGRYTHKFLNEGNYQVRIKTRTLGLTFYMPDQGILTIERFPGVIDIDNAPKLNQVPINWHLYRNRIATGNLLPILRGLNRAFPYMVEFGFDSESYYFAADAQGNFNAETTPHIQKVLFYRTQAEIDEAYKLIDKRWFLNYAIDAYYTPNRPMRVGDIEGRDSDGVAPVDHATCEIKMTTNSSITSEVVKKVEGELKLGPRDVEQERYIRLEFISVTTSTGGSTLNVLKSYWVNRNEYIGNGGIIYFLRTLPNLNVSVSSTEFMYRFVMQNKYTAWKPFSGTIPSGGQGLPIALPYFDKF